MHDRILDVPLYLGVAGTAQWFATVVLLLTWLAARRPSQMAIVSFLRRAAIFNAVLLLLGCAANSVWMVLVYKRWYVSADTVVDFFPFVPFDQWVLDQTFGQHRGRLLRGASMQQLQAVWVMFAVSVWAGSVLLFKRIVRQ